MEYKINSTEGLASNIGIATNITSVDGKMTIIPEAHFSQEFVLLMGKISVSTKSITPSLGFNLFNAITLNFGYNFAYQDQRFRGFNIGFNIFLGEEKFYDFLGFKAP